MKELCQKIRDDRRFEAFIVGVIIVAGIVVGLETNLALVATWGGLLHALDKVILTVFVAEIAIKMGAESPRPLNYFKSGWNIFDFTIVAVCLVPSTGPWVAVVRLARILRAVRLVTQIPRLQVLVGALLNSLPSMGYVSVLVGLHFYVYAVMGTFLFRDNDPGHFGELHRSMLTLFRVVTLEDWTDVMYTAIMGSDVYPAQGPIPVGPEPHAFGAWGILFFVSFVIIGAMVMINMFVGVLVNSLSEAEAEQLRHKLEMDTMEQHEAALEHKLGSIERDLQELRRLVQARRP